MTIPGPSPYGTPHHAYVDGLRDDGRARVNLASQAWDIAAAVEETRERDGDNVAVYLLLTTVDATKGEELRAYVDELGYAAELVPRKEEQGWLLRIGPERRRARKAHQRPRRLERSG